jgi:hypothetical protein
MKKDPQGGGTNADGTRSEIYCHWCYEDGKLLGGDTLDEFRENARKGMIENGDMNRFWAWLFTRRIFLKNLPRWKNQ